jgi:hypothetical protein
MRVMQMLLLLLFWVTIAFNGLVSAGLPFWHPGTSRVVDLLGFKVKKTDELKNDVQ